VTSSARLRAFIIGMAGLKLKLRSEFSSADLMLFFAV
jgi:hypothetical protein